MAHLLVGVAPSALLRALTENAILIQTTCIHLRRSGDADGQHGGGASSVKGGSG